MFFHAQPRCVGKLLEKETNEVNVVTLRNVLEMSLQKFMFALKTQFQVNEKDRERERER